MLGEILGLARYPACFQVGGCRACEQADATEPACHELVTANVPDADSQIKSFLHQVHDPVRHRHFEAHLRILRSEARSPERGAAVPSHANRSCAACPAAQRWCGSRHFRSLPTRPAMARHARRTPAGWRRVTSFVIRDAAHFRRAAARAHRPAVRASIPRGQSGWRPTTAFIGPRIGQTS